MEMCGRRKIVLLVSKDGKHISDSRSEDDVETYQEIAEP